MAILAPAIDIINSALAELGLPLVQLGVTTSDTTALQSLAMLNALGDELVRVNDWQFLEKVAGFVGDGTSEQFPMPIDYGRIVNQTQWAVSDARPLLGPDSPQIWAWNKYGIASVGVFYRYRILNNEMTVFPVPAANAEFAFYYISKNWVQDGEDPSMYKSRVTRETDVPVFDRRLLTSGLKAKLWAQKGFDTSVLQQEFLFALEAEKAQTGGARVINLTGCGGSFLLNQSNVPDTGYGL